MGAVQDSFDERLALGEIEPDAAQRAVVRCLDGLQAKLADDAGTVPFLKRLFHRQPTLVKGLYIHGGVGRGKTMLMDLFYEAAGVAAKRRAHFHEFMIDVHDRIGTARHDVPGDPIPHVAKELGREARLLCFDELHVTDIADAMILGRLFKALFEAGTVVVATSNAHPSQLYKNGLNRQLFEPFIALIEKHMDIVELDAEKDFRLDKLSGAQLYFSPNDAAARAALDAHWDRLTGKRPGKSLLLDVKGRQVRVPMASMGVARFSFDDLCNQPLGSNDYLHVAHAFHTVIIDDIPVIAAERRDVARRFINLIDALYDSRICLIASSATEPSGIYPQGSGVDLFQRTASRLTEMRSEAYLAGRPGGGRVWS